MKFRLPALVLIVCAFAFTSCRKKPEGNTAVLSGPPEAGALYSLNDGEGGYRVGKVVAAEDDVVFVNLFASRWPRRPVLADARKAAMPVPVAYSPQSFAGMQPVRLENGAATAEESEAYESWKLGKRETF